MCTSDSPVAARPARRRDELGFSLIEIILGFSLALTLALGVAPVWTGFQSVGVREGDKTIWLMQARVAGARLERDIRVAGAGGSLFATPGCVLQATATQVVLLVPASGSSVPLLVEWEIAGGSLMRRWGPCPSVLPASFSHSLYSDNKTMLEGIDVARSRFGYLVGGAETSAPLASADLGVTDRVSVTLVRRTAAPAGSSPSASVMFSEWLGR